MFEVTGGLLAQTVGYIYLSWNVRMPMPVLRFVFVSTSLYEP
jgi:hypothetical protein